MKLERPDRRDPLEVENAVISLYPNPGSLVWVRAEGGTFEMGSKRHGKATPRRKVTVASFAISKREVMVENYRLCVEAGKCTEPRTDDSGFCNWGQPDRDRHPVNCVTWHQARAFAAFANGRLPTEAEWEYAARALGRDIRYPWGHIRVLGCATASIDGRLPAGIYDGYHHRPPIAPPGCWHGTTRRVCFRSFQNKRLPFRTCDMIGNVEEWVEDAFVPGYEGAPTDGSAHVPDGWDGPRVLRGGGWNLHREELVDPYRFMDASMRRPESPDVADYNYGIRVARDLPESPPAL